ncbi:major facilitator family transporter [Obelidium mucronatum]|nr:major facilitator family transporter [Obelidium mucronatum]
MSAQAVATPKYADVTVEQLRKIVIASCAGTLIEWYDFFVFGSMASTTASLFYKTGTPAGDLIAWLAAFAVGFMFRPFGAIVFGYIGDRVGRKFTFTFCLVLMGVSTFLCGCLPTYNDIGIAAGVLLIILRIIQGLAIGGEYGGAATYIAEHCPQEHRGFWTSFLQATATGGLILSLAVILIFRTALGDANWVQYGWRFPFILSIVLVGASLYIRLKMAESPMYAESKAQNKMVGNPFVESFMRPYNLYFVSIALFGATMGQGVVWYTAQFYTLTFIQSTLKVPLITSYLIVLIAAVLTLPSFIFVGHLSDKFGRRPFILAGMFLGAALFYPFYMGLHAFRPFENNKTSEPYRDAYSPAMLTFITWLMVNLVALVYGPIAAYLVELFPTPIRCTSLSLPYHIGNGIFGGLVPVIGVTIATNTGNIFGGLFYPIGIAGACFLIALVVMKETVGT